MVGQIYHTSNCWDSKYPEADWHDFISWADEQHQLQVDVETCDFEYWCTTKIVSIQIGSCTADRRQYFFQWECLNWDQKQYIKLLMEDKRIQKLAHNAMYEYVVLRFHGIICENLYCTMLAEKVLRGGLENIQYALADISWKYLRVMMDKTLQKSFTRGMMMSDEHIRYGITDVAYLDVIKREQYTEACAKGLLNVFALEMEVLPAFGDITFEGMILDVEKWRENERLAIPLFEEATKQINSWLLKEPFRSYATQQGYISEEDRLVFNANSHQQKIALLKLLFPEIPGATLVILKAYVRDHAQELTIEQMEILICLQQKNTFPLLQYLKKYHREDLIRMDMLIPAGQSTLNWGSHIQVLPIFQLVLPKMKSTGEEERNKFSHPILKDYEKYSECKKLITDLGESFIQKHLEPDGRVRTNFNQVVSTGRVSSSKPNMQNITVKEFVGTRYRNAFVADPGCDFVSSDFTGQELAIIAHVSQDPVWLNAITNGLDLHSICAEMVYGYKWKDGAEKDCAYYYAHVDKHGVYHPAGSQLKCDCKKHKKLRYDVKTVNFGLAYGMSAIKLSGEIEVTVAEAINLIERYFEIFPNIGRTLTFLGNYGVTNGYIQTLAPFYRKRWFPEWEMYKPWIEPHVRGIKYVPVLGEIERASKNMPIQGSGADMMKIAMILVRDYIRDNDLRKLVKLKCQVHDQLDTNSVKEFSETWKGILDDLMCEAAKVIIPSGILHADTNITEVWTK